jgi:hypothetical protein
VLEQESIWREFRQVQKEGEREVSRKIAIYNLDVIISIGYRIKSNIGTEFNKINYDKVIAYELDKKIKGFILEASLLNTKIIKNQKELSPTQIDSLQNFLSFTEKTKEVFGKECYNQHSLGIVYYSNDKIVACFSISPNCNLFMLYIKN